MSAAVACVEAPPLAAGDECFAIIREQSGGRSKSGDRGIVKDAVRVRVAGAVDADRYAVIVMLGRRVPPGHNYILTRDELFDVKSADERSRFRALVVKYWGAAWRGQGGR